MPPFLVAGAGIGGLTAAIALARRGLPVVVAEQRTGFGETGAGLQLSPNAGHVLAGLDLGLPLKRVGVVPQRLVVRGWRSGATLGEMPMDAGSDATPFRVVRRTDLHTILLDAARSLPGIRWQIGRRLDEARETDDGIAVTLVNEKGQAETLSASALIGADGLWSRARVLAGDAAPPAFGHREAWRTLLPAAAAPAALRVAEVGLALGRGAHAVHYPVAGGREINMVVIREAREPRQGWSRAGDPAELAALARQATPALRDAIAAAPGWLVWSLFDRAPAAMARGRIALIGDAAHPVLPFLAQGAALAIEDAAVLAHHVARGLDAGGPAALPGALAAYAEDRRQRARRVQETSRANGRAYHLPRPFSLARDLVMRRLGPEGMRERHAWVYDWRAPA